MVYIYSKEKLKKINDELFKGEKIIEKEINKSNNIENGFKKFGLLDVNWYKNYINFLNNSNFEKKNNNFFSYNLLMAKIDKRDHTYLGENKFKFNCPCNFILVTEEFMNIISENFKNPIEK